MTFILFYWTLTLVYSLRSKIVHGVKYKKNKLEEFSPFLQNLVSRMNIELILQNIGSLKKLNRKLNFAGYGVGLT